jgi:hemerythrin-like metal-binding protein
MARIEWNSSLSVQNDELDSQHKELLRLYNDLHEALVNAPPEKTTRTKIATIDALMVYTLHHFATEERYLESLDFPGRREHRRLHQEFGEQVFALKRDIQSDQTVLATSLIKFMRNWILEHIAEKDKEYSDFSSRSRQEP